MEAGRRRAFALARGLQANGVPAYKAYQHACSSVIQYFDTRASAALQITDAELETRHIALRAGQTIRLAFSGRLIRMKGAHHLVEVACHLRNLNVPFTLDIFGDGALGDEIKNQIETTGLSGQVRFRGVAGFESELMPFMKQHVDLFVCCHPQGDPSCTYMETLSCGVPIIGYANEALDGLAEIADVGWVCDVGNSFKIAQTIAALPSHGIIQKSRNAISFARRHSFETTFERRVNHWRTVLDSSAKI